MTLPDLSDSERIALFLDFDGTLVAIADRPDEVQLDLSTRKALMHLDTLLGGAIAIVTGREIAAVDRFLDPLRLSVAGVHGLTRRDAQGHMHTPDNINGGFAAAIERAAWPIMQEYPALFLEYKYGAVALHYRSHPELEQACIALMEAAVDALPGVELKRGKMVVEAKAVGGNKGAAIADYLNEKPFAGRRAVFAGDDVTDEDAFILVNARDGVSIKVGPGETHATYRAAGTGEFLAWLRQLPAKLGG
ncbi:MAG: trehalose-phosphatase [Xanthobacteraceae bacterium]|nr:trehalose-phosphatase [Xanthobacteraceae bacterium]